MNKALVEVGKTEKHLETLERCGWFPVEDGFDLSRVHFNIGGGEDIAKVFTSVDTQFAFERINKKFILVKSLEDFPNMFAMLLWIVGVDQDIIHVHYNKDIKYISEHSVNKPLECGRSIS